MTHRIRLLVGIFLAVSAVSLLSCSRESSNVNAKEASSSAVKETPAPDAGQSSEPMQVAQATPPPADPEASAAYSELLQEIRGMEKEGGGTQQSMIAMVDRMETLFKDYIGKYPESVEAKDAKFQLGLIYTTLQRAKLAVTYLSDYIDSSEGENAEKVGYAYYYLAEAYKASDKFDEAKKHYEKFISDYPTANPQAIAQARVAIEDMGTLKKLAIGSEPIAINVKGSKGEDLNLEKYKGKVVLLDFWATWCGPCRADMPHVVQLYKKNKDKGFEIIGVSLDQNRAAFDRYIQANDMAWPQHFDGRGWNNEIAMKYRIRSVPATFLLDRDGKIRYRSIRGKDLEQAVEKLLAETS
jgi:thiol-disulfide isomerase/thioredoxin